MSSRGISSSVIIIGVDLRIFFSQLIFREESRLRPSSDISRVDILSISQDRSSSETFPEALIVLLYTPSSIDCVLSTTRGESSVLERIEGDSERIEPEREAIEEEPGRIEEAIEGEPGRIEEAIEGEPGRIEGDSERIEPEREVIEGDPERIEERIGVESEDIEREPERIGVESEDIEREPERIDGESERIQAEYLEGDTTE